MIFVTGGTGMVGAHLIYDLVQKGEKVRALRRPGSSLQRIEKIFSFYCADYELFLQKIEWVEGDLLDKDGLRELLKGVDQIYHAAAIVSFDSHEKVGMQNKIITIISNDPQHSTTLLRVIGTVKK